MLTLTSTRSFSSCCRIFDISAILSPWTTNSHPQTAQLCSVTLANSSIKCARHKYSVHHSNCCSNNILFGSYSVLDVLFTTFRRSVPPAPAGWLEQIYRKYRPTLSTLHSPTPLPPQSRSSHLIHSLVFRLRGRVGRNQSPVMWPVWLWHTASWASSWG